MSPYLLDANVFIEAKKRYYGFDICPAFWDWLIQKNEQGKVRSTAEVKKEICDYEGKADDREGKDDKLKDWIKEFSFLPKNQEELTLNAQKVSDWVLRQDYKQGVANHFLHSSADYWLIAAALTHSYTLVTDEQPGKKKKITIPDVCKAFDVPCINSFTMLRQEKARFILSQEPP